MPETEVTTRQKQRGSRSLLAKVKRLLGFTTKNEVEEQPSRGNQATAHKREMEVSRQGSPPAASYSNWGSVKNSSALSQNENLKIVFSVLIGFFLSVFFLEGTVNEFGFWVTVLTYLINCQNQHQQRKQFWVNNECDRLLQHEQTLVFRNDCII